MHSEFNPSQEDDTSLLQIWIFPEKHELTPRYDQKRFEEKSYANTIYRVVNNEPNDNSLYIHQKAVLSLSKSSKGKKLEYQMHYPSNGIYVFLIEGKAVIGETTLLRRDAIGVWETDRLSVKAEEDSFILFIEVPMR